jgi:hypothetical protein
MKEFSQAEVDKKVKEMFEAQKKPNILICGQNISRKKEHKNG